MVLHVNETQNLLQVPLEYLREIAQSCPENPIVYVIEKNSPKFMRSPLLAGTASPSFILMLKTINNKTIEGTFQVAATAVNRSVIKNYCDEILQCTKIVIYLGSGLS